VNNRKPDPDEMRIDRIVILQADDLMAWDEPILVRPETRCDDISRLVHIKRLTSLLQDGKQNDD
jgi:hypothetical protein